MYCEQALVTVNDSCSCVDVKSGLLYLRWDLNPCDKKQKQNYNLFKPSAYVRETFNSSQETRCRNSSASKSGLCDLSGHARCFRSQSLGISDPLRCTDKLSFFALDLNRLN